MTEAEWHASTQPEKMLGFLLGQEAAWPLRLLRLFARQRAAPSDRKLRLFLCACVRQVWDMLDDAASERAVVVAEQFADGHASAAELQGAYHDAAIAADTLDPTVRGPAAFNARSAAVVVASPRPNATDAQAMLWYCGRAAALRGVVHDQGSLVRHIFGNPFRAYPTPASWPSVVVDLGHALYGGEDCSPILADAVEESGHTPLASHLRDDHFHPKGCWAVDLILGKN